MLWNILWRLINSKAHRCRSKVARESLQILANKTRDVRDLIESFVSGECPGNAEKFTTCQDILNSWPVDPHEAIEQWALHLTGLPPQRQTRRKRAAQPRARKSPAKKPASKPRKSKKHRRRSRYDDSSDDSPSEVSDFDFEAMHEMD